MIIRCGVTSFIELGRMAELKEIVHRDLDVFLGYALERYFHQKFKEETSYAKMGGWWDRKGENEIDLVCSGLVPDVIDFYEIKRNRKRIDLSVVKTSKTAKGLEMRR